MTKKVYIVLLNYNGWEDTIECLESVLKNDYDNYQIIVVDNDSPNNSMEYIINWAEGKQEIVYDENSQLRHLSQPFELKPLKYIYYKKEEALKGGEKEKELELNNNPLILIQAGENGGFAAGNNIGIKYALAKNDFEYIWLLNNDTVIEENSLSSLVNYASKNNLGISGSTLLYYDNPKMVQAYGGTINKFFGTSKHILDQDEIEKKLDYVVGASFLISKKVIHKIGLLPEEYFLYYEETDYCFNARNNDFKLGVCVDSKVYHKEGNSTGASGDSNNKNDFSDVLILKNRIKFHKKYLGGGISLWLGIMIAFMKRVKRGHSNRILKVLYDSI
ncbi:glycosyltransferase family 2 protein [Nitratifractor salsuginis]|uniref:Glycosyl transferase family 2 n=1 Tax=Nitratifractor salsuginis (strain DSM 16511 / JCM 12458 / E9I37-1) TaxID=749222 RepID=E6WZM4_NITSE|nr:glycosyltransferase family 2 protein [Nitratifractor salsuginis]ADV46665.1 glycosyl transferase family 2 [Nitratifractor salsuginis DSM 16511]